MPQMNFHYDEEENQIIEFFAEKWGLKNKIDTLRRMIREYGVKEK
jgi:hypothetical protein